MKLVDLIKNIAHVERYAIIYLADINDWTSDIVRAPEEAVEESDDQMIWIEGGNTYHYLLEVHVAIEFLEGWYGTQMNPTIEQAAVRLYRYGINDA